MAIKVLYTANATAKGGRSGHTQSDDGVVSVDLSMPQVAGGTGKAGTTTPEHLFAAGYAACFGSACDVMAQKFHLAPVSLEINAAVGFGPDSAGGYGLTVELEMEAGGLSQADAQKIADAAHEICPYSKAIRGNVDVKIRVAVT
jgi:osmotically inducible protein OsmC